MMCEMRRRKPKLTLLPTQGIFNVPHHIGMVCNKLAFDDALHGKWLSAQLDAIAVTRIRSPVPRVTFPRAATSLAISQPPRPMGSVCIHCSFLCKTQEPDVWKWHVACLAQMRGRKKEMNVDASAWFHQSGSGCGFSFVCLCGKLNRSM